MIEAARVGAVVLAAGAGSRFGGGKLSALLDGRPVLQHVLDTVAGVGFGVVVVVVGADGDRLEAAIDWRGEQRVVNPTPERGLSGSVRLGFGALPADGPDAAMVLLGDQPQVDAGVIRTLLGASLTEARPAAVPRYAGSENPNPVLLLRSAWPLVEGLTGDRGLGPMLRARSELVVEVPVPGANPDIDTPDDLARLERRAGELSPGAGSA